MPPDPARLADLARRANDELVGDILPFWLALADNERGGHIGGMSFDGVIDTTRPKTAVFTARLLWFFSEVHRVLRHAEAGLQAARAKRFLLDRLEDKDQAGLFWSVSADGQVLEEDKHLYAQAFGIYGLSAHALAFADEEAATAALRLFRTIMDRASTANGFIEAFDRHWQQIPNRRLSPPPIRRPERSIRTCTSWSPSRR